MIKKISHILSTALASLFVISCSNGLPPGENFFPTNAAKILLNNDKGQWTIYIDCKDVSKIVGLSVITNENLGKFWIQISQMGTPNSALPKNFTIQWTPAGLNCTECTGGLKNWMRRIGN
jgi:hypothetical protein